MQYYNQTRQFQSLDVLRDEYGNIVMETITIAGHRYLNYFSSFEYCALAKSVADGKSAPPSALK